MSYEAILFDLDNTLYDYDAYWRQRLHWSLEPVQESYPHLDIAALAARAMQEHVYARQFADFLQRSGVHDVAVCHTAVERYRVNFYEQLTLYASTPQLLQALHGRYRLGIITNGPARTQRPKIEHLQLEPFMHVCIISEEVGCAKPDPAIFHLALRQLGTVPEHALYVGDSLNHDLMGAHAAGLHFVWMNPKRRKLPPDMPQPWTTITDLAMLHTLLNA